MLKPLHYLVFPAESPGITITIYYLFVILLGWLVLWLVPDLRGVVSGERLAELGRTGIEFSFTNPSAAAPGQWLSWQFALSLGASMVGAFLLMIPATWVYMATRRRKGFDQSIVHTMVILAVAVSGVVVIVRNSVALAFSLAGIVGAVRFRQSLQDTRDTLYIFLSIGVGLAAGAEVLAAAAVFSAVFNYLVLTLWRADYGLCEIGTRAAHVLYTRGEDPAEAKKGGQFNAVLLVRTRDPAQAKSAVEPLLAKQLKRWRLAEEDVHGEETILKYLIRLRKSAKPGDVEDAVLVVGGPSVIGAKIH